MKKSPFALILLMWPLAWVSAEETTVQVAPSDQIIYPDASQILNKTEPSTTKPLATKAQTTTAIAPATTALPSTKPLVAATPVPARKPSAPAPVATTKELPATAEVHGWFLRWTVSGDEAPVRAWAATLDQGAQVNGLSPGLWEVLSGPLESGNLKKALEGQAGKAQLVKK